MEPEKILALKQMSRTLRHRIIDMIGPEGHTGHWGGSSSACDIVTTLYFDVMRGCKDSRDPERDRLILSKGHAALVQYAALAELGVISVEELDTVKRIGSRLQGHPDAAKCPGIEANTGSLGMGLSEGLGMAMSLTEGQRVFVILGDGELAEGQVWEAAMAAAGKHATNLTAIVDRNRVQATAHVEKVLPLGDLAGKWSAFGWNVVETDGHDLEALCRALRVTDPQRPTAIIAETVKGKGLSFAEDSADWHNGSFDAGTFVRAHWEIDAAFGDGLFWNGSGYQAAEPAALPSLAAGSTASGGPKRSSLRRAYGETLTELGERYPELTVLEADLSRSTMGNLFGAAYPERFVEMGIAEQNMASVAAGMALCGKMPFMASFAVFSTGRCYDQIRSNICIPKLNVKICGSSAGLSDFGDGSTHQSVDDISLMRTLPGMRVFVPCDAPETRRILTWMAENPGPMYIRITRADLPEITPERPFVPGEVTVLREGADAVVFCCGMMVSEVLAAAERLAENGISVRVVNVPSIKPLRPESVREAAGQRRVFAVEDHSIYGGLGDAICEVLGPVCRIGMEDAFGHSALDVSTLLESCGLSAGAIAERIRAAL